MSGAPIIQLHQAEAVLAVGQADAIRDRVDDPRVQALCASSFNMGQLSAAAVEYSAGYVSGWRWGLVCGAIGAALLGAALFLAGVAGHMS